MELMKIEDLAFVCRRAEHSGLCGSMCRLKLDTDSLKQSWCHSVDFASTCNACRSRTHISSMQVCSRLPADWVFCSRNCKRFRAPHRSKPRDGTSQFLPPAVALRGAAWCYVMVGLAGCFSGSPNVATAIPHPAFLSSIRRTKRLASKRAPPIP